MSDTPANPPAEKPECFVIMPIGEKPERPGHFRRVYEDIFVPACDKAGFKADRGGEDKTTGIIHLDILRKLLKSPMALCDLTGHNPNVLFELGIRQAFDMPVALVAEDGTGKIFDTDILWHHEYKKARLYHEVLEDQREIAKILKKTYARAQSGDNTSSLIRLLDIGFTKATLPEKSTPEESVGYLVGLVERMSADIQLLKRSKAVSGKPITQHLQGRMDLARWVEELAEKYGFNAAFLQNEIQSIPIDVPAEEIIKATMQAIKSSDMNIDDAIYIALSKLKQSQP